MEESGTRTGLRQVFHMRTPLNRIERAAGVFVIGATLMAVSAVLLSRRGDIAAYFRKDFVVHAVAKDASGAVVGSSIRVHDVDVGSVSKVELAPDPNFPDRPVRFTLEIQPSAAPFLSNDTVASIQGGLPGLGAGIIALESKGTRPLERGATIIADPAPSLFSFLTNDAKALTDDIRRVLAEVELIVKGIRSVTDRIAEGEGLAGQLVAKGGMEEELAGFLTDARGTVNESRQLIASSRRITDTLPETLRETTDTAKEGKVLLQKVNAVMDAMPAIMASVDRTIAQVEELMASLRSTAHFAPELARKADSSLEETQRLVEAAQKNVLIRGSIERKPVPRTDAIVRPPVLVPEVGGR